MKKLLTGLLIAAFMVIAAGCGGGQSAPDASAAAGAEATAETAEAAEQNDAGEETPEATENTEAAEEASESEDQAGTSDTPAAVSTEFPILEDTRGEEYKENTFTTLNGDEVTYNMNTRKIVCIFGSQDVVAFGIPLLAYEGTTEIEGYEDFYGDAQALLNSSPFSPEEVLSYEPELILVNQRMSESQIEQLSQIAPTIPLYTDSTDFATRLGYIGEIFGLEESADKLIAYEKALREDMIAQLDALNLRDKTLTIYTYMGAISIPPDRGWFMNTIIYDYAGIKRLPIVEEFMKDESGMAYEAISAEKLKEYEGDMVIYAGFEETDISTYVSENVGWQSLDAVKENRVGIIDITPYAQKGVILLKDQYGQVLEALKVAGQKTE